MDRRTFLGALGNSVLLAAGSEALPLDLAKLKASPLNLDSIRGIDVHCHIFNASDLPVGPFLSEVQLKQGARSPLRFITGAAAEIFQRKAPTAREEVQWLKRAHWASARKSGISQGNAVFMRSEGVGDADDADERFAQVWDEISREAPDVHKQFFQEYAASQQALNPAVSIRTLGEVPLKDLAAATANDPGAVNYLVQAELRSETALSPYLAFLKTFVRYRYENAMTLFAMHGEAKRHPISLITPSLVDFDLWIGPAKCAQRTTSSIAEQIDVAASIAEATDQNVHCLAPFNPLRAAVDPHYFDLVERAVTEKGCLGFKIYPPMGFAPSDNPNGLVRKLDCSAPVSGDRIDTMMERFFALCAKQRLPILAHGSPSNSPAGSDQKSVLGSPDAWERAFSRFPKYFGGSDPAVRVAIAHFGGISTPKSTLKWADRIAGLMERHACLYTDTAYFGDLLGERTSREALLGRLTPLLGKGPIKERLMYGSDWSMLAVEHDVPVYPEKVEAALDAARLTDSQKDAVFYRNAFRFYDLGRYGKGRQRFETFGADKPT